MAREKGAVQHLARCVTAIVPEQQQHSRNLHMKTVRYCEFSAH